MCANLCAGGGKDFIAAFTSFAQRRSNRNDSITPIRLDNDFGVGCCCLEFLIASCLRQPRPTPPDTYTYFVTFFHTFVNFLLLNFTYRRGRLSRCASLAQKRVLFAEIKKKAECVSTVLVSQRNVPLSRVCQYLTMCCSCRCYVGAVLFSSCHIHSVSLESDDLLLHWQILCLHQIHSKHSNSLTLLSIRHTII